VGRLTYYKGYDVLIQAMAQVHNAQICIVGHGELQPALSNLVQRLHLAHKVKLLGYCSDAELQALFSVCDCFCLSSIDRAEAFGVVLIEAMGYAKPVIASAIPGSGVSWVVDNGRAGLLTPTYAISELAQTLQMLVDQPALRWQLGEKGQQRFQQLFDIQQVAKTLTPLYTSFFSKNLF
jgi:rhamnosyl/mannosyltransferase